MVKNSEEFRRIEERKENARRILKTEYFGIDTQIDEVLDSISPWLHFPELQTKPLVVNLWGMTGCGKTSLVDRLIELLGLNSRKQYFSFNQVDDYGYSARDMGADFDEHTGQMGLNTPILIYDEFQYAKTINEEGKECDQKSIMGMFWTLLDTGIFYDTFDSYVKSVVRRAELKVKGIMGNDDIRFANGEITEGVEEWKKLCYPLYKKRSDRRPSLYMVTVEEEGKKDENKNVIFDDEDYETFFRVLNTVLPDDYPSYDVIYDQVESILDKGMLMRFIMMVKQMAMEQLKMDYSKALIFVMGNLDEAYGISDDVNPDMSADQYHTLTKDISSITIKTALQKRFRLEQIARLGNIHVIYTALPSKAYRQIIEKNLEFYRERLLSEHGIRIAYDRSIADICYKDGVFPTQGARPLMSTIYDLVHTKISLLVMHTIEHKVTYHTILYKYRSGYFMADFLDEAGRVVSTFKMKQRLRVECYRLGKNRNLQALTAVHEAGHFIANLELLRNIPEKMVSATATAEIAGFVLPSIDKSAVLNRDGLTSMVAVYLAGRAAEELVFGKEAITGSASSDLKSATELVVSAIREYGFNENLLLTNGWAGADKNRLYDRERGDGYIASIVSAAYREAKACIEAQESLFFETARYLNKHYSMGKRKIKEYILKHYNGDKDEIRNVVAGKVLPGEYEQRLDEVLSHGFKTCEVKEL